MILAWVSVEYRSTPEPNPHPLVQTNSYLQESQPIPKHAASFQRQPTSAVPEQEEEQEQRHETVAAAQRSPRKRYFFSHGKNKVVLWKYLQSLGAACFFLFFFNIYLQIFFLFNEKGTSGEIVANNSSQKKKNVSPHTPTPWENTASQGRRHAAADLCLRSLSSRLHLHRQS